LAGTITILASNEVRISDRTRITANATNSDNSGYFSAITIGTTDYGVLLLDRATLTTTNTGSGYAGSISLGFDYPNRRDIPTRRVEIRNNSHLSSTGNAGYILVQGLDKIVISNSELDAESTIETFNPVYLNTILIGSPGEIVLDDVNINTSNSNSPGAAGNLIVTAGRQVLIRNTSVLRSEGSGGQLFIGRFPASTLGQDSGLNPLSRSFQNSVPTSVSIDDSNLEVDNQQGRAGNLGIRAGSLRIAGSNISAITGANENVVNQVLNIRIDVSDTLFELYDRSRIQAGGVDEGDGGNVTINVPNGFIFADPYGDSDVLANANRGRGGNINITTNAIFGLEERDSVTPLSDINAASQFSTDGVVLLNTLNIDPTQGLSELPNEPGTPEIVNACGSQSRPGVDNEVGEPSFTQTGRAGLPVSPGDTLGVDSVLDDLGAPHSDLDTAVDSVINPLSTIATTSPSEIIEAQGWTVDAEGNVVLIANGAANPSWQLPLNCTAMNQISP